jgi:hypothetical protein
MYASKVDRIVLGMRLLKVTIFIRAETLVNATKIKKETRKGIMIIQRT